MIRRALEILGTTGASLALAGSLSIAELRDARACGGCFHAEPAPGTTQSPSVVTDHRMVVALGQNLTTLWDQIEYAGDPAEFAWVLPIRGGVAVGLGSDAFINTLDQQTAPTILAPRRRCARPRTDSCGGSNSAGCAGSSEATSEFDFDAGFQEDSGVFVTSREVVGPYAVVQVHGTDEGSIIGWLRDKKFLVPKDIEPILGKYVSEGFDFVAVRLRAKAGLNAMVPIRVSWKGSTPSLPLRMVRAGVGAKVGIKLFVIGDGRWKTANYPTFSVDPAGVSWNFLNQRSDYTTIRDAMAAGFDGRAFSLESSIDIPRSTLPSIKPSEFDAGTATTDALVEDATDGGLDGDAIADGDAVGDAAEVSTEAGADASPDASDAVVEDTAKPTYDAGKPPAIDPYATDVEIAYGTFLQRRVTRLRADLPAKYLDTDLVLEADMNQSVLSRTVQVDRADDAPVCPGTASVAGEGSELPIRTSAAILLAALGAILARRAAKKNES